jgi:hypothetical protein
MELEHVEVGGLGVAYRRAGTGPALPLVHGALGTAGTGAGSWRGWPASSPWWPGDAPGCGGSDDPPETFRLPDFADCLAGFAAAVGLERADREAGLPPEHGSAATCPGCSPNRSRRSCSRRRRRPCWRSARPACGP